MIVLVCTEKSTNKPSYAHIDKMNRKLLVSFTNIYISIAIITAHPQRKLGLLQSLSRDLDLNIHFHLKKLGIDRRVAEGKNRV